MRRLLMNIKAEKERMLNDLIELKLDAKILLGRVDLAISVLKDVQTEEDLKAFVERFDGFSEDLEHIEVF